MSTLGAGRAKGAPLAHVLPRKQEERLRKAPQARERAEQMEEKKKKRVEQKILQSDEKVRRLSGLWASLRAVKPGGVSRALVRSIHARIPSGKGRFFFSIPLHIPVGTGPVHASLCSWNVAAPACPGHSPAGDSLTWPMCSDGSV